MPRGRLLCSLAIVAVGLAGVGVERPVLPADAAGAEAKIREPAVAGLFYPRDPAELARTIDSLLAQAHEQPIGLLRALVCPHAGYPFSGPVAAYAYKLLQGRRFETVIVVGPSHYALLSGASVADATLYRTPLGDVPVSGKAIRLASVPPFALEPECPVERPDWWTQSSRTPAGRETAETWEHSVEVEVPFLQRALGRFEIVPVLCGQADPALVARGLAGILDDRTLIVASSDLSHYHPYDQACQLDRGCVDAICRLDVGAMQSQEACGKVPILALMDLARERGWRARLLDMRNSGDTGGPKSRVVGYAAIGFFEPAGPSLGDRDRLFLLEEARGALRAAANLAAPAPPSEPPSPALSEPRACFVTLTEEGRLRGCVGAMAAREPLARAVADSARCAALLDPRFPPVGADEVDRLRIEVSVLTTLRRLWFSSPEDLLMKLEPGCDGVLLRIGDRTATYLPQVWKDIPDKAAFMDSLAEKSGCAAAQWRGSDVEVFVYEVESFQEPDGRPP